MRPDEALRIRGAGGNRGSAPGLAEHHAVGTGGLVELNRAGVPEAMVQVEGDIAGVGVVGVGVSGRVLVAVPGEGPRIGRFPGSVAPTRGIGDQEGRVARLEGGGERGVGGCGELRDVQRMDQLLVNIERCEAERARILFRRIQGAAGKDIARLRVDL